MVLGAGKYERVTLMLKELHWWSSIAASLQSTPAEVEELVNMDLGPRYTPGLLECCTVADLRLGEGGGGGSG